MERGRALDSSSVSLRKEAVKSGVVEAFEKYSVEECETGALERMEGVSNKDVLQREQDDGGQRLYEAMRKDDDGFKREEVEKEEGMDVWTGTKNVVCGDGVGKKNVLANLDEIWLTVGGEKSESETGDGRTSDRISVKGVAGPVYGFDSSVVCLGLALGGFAVLCGEENVGMFADGCIAEPKSFKATDVIDYPVQKMKLESA